MDTTAVTGVAALSGIAVPFAVSFLKSKNWSTQVKHMLSLVVSLVVAFGITTVDNGVSISNWHEFVLNSGVVFATANVFYNQILSGSTVNYTLENSGVK